VEGLDGATVLLAEIDGHQRLVLRLIGMIGPGEGEDQPKDQTLVTVDFREENGRTIQTFRQSPFSTVTARDSHIGGWQSLFGVEEGYLKSL